MGLKLNLPLHDCLDRAWQCGNDSARFLNARCVLGSTYVAEDNERKTPVMIHRAILGSLERFIGILIEEYAGFFPTLVSAKTGCCNEYYRQTS